MDWFELNQLKKDILWVFDENTGQLNASFIPPYSFKSKYWEYLNLNANDLLTEDSDFYFEGILIIILCMIAEYIDTTSGEKSFRKPMIPEIDKCVEAFKPKNGKQEKLKALVRLGLTIAYSMEEKDLLNTDGYHHKDLDEFLSQLKWVDETFIKAYFRSKL